MISGIIQHPPELRFTASGKPLLTFDLLVKAGSKERIFHVVAWEGMAEMIAEMDQFFTPLAEITIDGYQHDRSWHNASTGESGRIREYVVTNLITEPIWKE